MTDPDARHISSRTLNEYVEAGVRASIPVPGSPDVLLTVDGSNQTLSLEVSWDGEQPPVIREYVHISTDVVHRHGRNWAVVTVHGIRFFTEAYPLLRSVADLIQLKGTSFAAAAERSLARYHDLLASIGQMPVQQEAGLFGELLVVAHLIGTIGPGPAVAAWRGGDQSEEHDFGLPHDDVEVKITTSEQRRHWIGSIHQLRPSPRRRLWLLSIQLTAGGASDAERLPDVVDRVERQLPDGLRPHFLTRLGEAGFRVQQPTDTYRSLRPRSEPGRYVVDDGFPRLGLQLLRTGGARLDRITDVSYMIDLDGMQSAGSLPAELVGFGREDAR